MDKTNVMRILDNAHINYSIYHYENETNGLNVAKLLNKDPNMVFKTLVTVGSDFNHYVFMVPVCAELDLKKAAQAAHVKNIEMIKQKELLPLTGYIHGGCSPIGMKKKFPSFIDETALLFDRIIFSAGKIGYQEEVDVNEIIKFLDSSVCDLTT